ncbi:RHS repeat domain-containing protein [Thiothrix winogradskyi]|uniref:RHS repeat-associated core domain-containing protein n=1 Tax=Thiothrix winogradskyi TaxID=96472 RepID=A0ABY3SXH2_9GAMM|nr:RHS repeat-associated core domain-containing protein [Thiothrix winogradskyi]UJS23592.1 hypothetical protein L2Y54_16855 [Thiothrix winogradskyi]
MNDRLTQYKHSLYVGDKVVAIQVRTLKNGVKTPDEMRYLHHDALGNVDTLTNGSGKVIQRLNYDPFGKRSVTFGMDADQKAWTAQGFTGHEHLDGLGLIDMNARLYDPEIGRFLSADTLIPDAGLMHSYNRHIYVLNNPLKYTDPSGHSWLSDRWEDFTNSIRQAAGWIRDNFTLVANIAIQALLPGAGSLAISIMRGAAAGFVGGLVSTGSLQGAVQGAFWGGIGAGVAGFVGHGGAFGYAWGDASPFGNMRLLAHGASQGLITQLRGGNFRSGMVGAVAGGLSPAGDMLAHGGGNIVSRSVIAAVFGGLAAQASGGSFADGALSAAMVHLFNDERNWWRVFRQGQLAHQRLQAYLTGRDSNLIADRGRWVDQDGNKHHVAGFFGSGTGRVDLTNTASNEVWEIKPNSIYGHATGPAQLASYVLSGGLVLGGNLDGLNVGDTLTLPGFDMDFSYYNEGGGMIYYDSSYSGYDAVGDMLRNGPPVPALPLPGLGRFAY